MVTQQMYFASENRSTIKWEAKMKAIAAREGDRNRKGMEYTNAWQKHAL